MKPFSALATAGGAAHNGFERWSGVGVFLEPWIGRRATDVLWTLAPPLLLWRATVDEPLDEAMTAFGAGVAVAGAGVHFVEWPWSRRFGFLPWLDEAEGMPPSHLPAYNTILWLWMLGGVGSIAFETRRRHLKWAAAGIATAPLLVASARHHFAWAHARAESGDPNFRRFA
ncbi:hypothetical protein [Jatrophihabitans endophyticus]|uniref:hypothetical protein n=1 Tax=Jatrophihabitans endophyticus TaxID=1206085 RepID=UPI001A05996E|nr:hypothetical protein [Jatrophihabitans endophyticus]MBE7187630.1 hypothetical protein [Jatrophihabitans endophyticus]